MIEISKQNGDIIFFSSDDLEKFHLDNYEVTSNKIIKKKYKNLNEFILNFSGLGKYAILKDLSKKTLLFVTDCYGLNDFYYKVKDNNVYISDYLYKISDNDDEIDEVSLIEIFINGQIGFENTPYLEIKKIFPFSFLEINYQDKIPSIEIKYIFPEKETPINQLNFSIKNVINSLDNSKNIGILFSGGIDSTLISKQAPPNTKLAHFYKKKFHLQSFEAFLNKSNNELHYINVDNLPFKVDTKNMPTCIHEGILNFEPIVKFLKYEGINTIISGQNADTVMQLRNTRKISLYNFFRNIFLFGFNSNAISTYLTRSIMNGSFLNNKKLLNLYKRYHLKSDNEFNISLFKTFCTYNNSNPFPLDIENLFFLNYKLYEKFTNRITRRVKNILNFENITQRQKFLNLFLSTGGIGSDHRVITSLCKKYELNNCQIFTHPEIMEIMFFHKPKLLDNFFPKRIYKLKSKYKTVNHTLLKNNTSFKSYLTSFLIDNDIKLKKNLINSADITEMLNNVEKKISWFNWSTIFGFERFSSNWILCLVYFHSIINKEFTDYNIGNIEIGKYVNNKIRLNSKKTGIR